MSSQVKAHSTSTGAVIGPEADVTGLGGVLSLLINEHGELARAISRMFAAKTAEERRDIYPALRTDLLAHERTEQSVVYVTLQQFSATHAPAQEHAQQVSELSDLIFKLDSLPIHSEEWIQELVLLSVHLQRHVRQEEDQLFPLARTAIGERLSHDLKVAYLAQKAGIMNTIEAEAPQPLL
ncbi:MAG TPA: hemerythrin domain-containing protein [Polyangiaceae bacterium]|nr:hemerythrin domain-containing protein [Polyangiaceae bacterium]